MEGKRDATNLLLSKMEMKFNSFDKTGTGKGFVPCDELAAVMKSLGMSANANKLNDIIFEEPYNHFPDFNFSEFLSLIDKIGGADSFDTLVAADFITDSETDSSDSDGTELYCPLCKELLIGEYMGENHFKICTKKAKKKRSRKWNM